MRKARGERGQVVLIMTLVLVALLGIGAFAIDVGYAYYAKRQLQSATDAAALAGAQDLPQSATAITTAKAYAAANIPTNLSGLTFTYSTKCTSTSVIASGCVAATNPNELIVNGSASTNTWFARLFGINHFDVTTHANACSPCSASPVDIVIAIDRTGSMCLDSRNRHDCTDLNNAKNGVRTMLSMMNPPYAQIGMVAFPPLPSGTTNMCNAPEDTSGNNFTAYDNANNVYVDDKIGTDYKAAGVINEASNLAKHMTIGDGTCIKADGYTSYSEALRQAQAELLRDGRPDVPDVIVFLTDGEANIGSIYGYGNAKYPPGNYDDENPCQSAINVAKAIKLTGTVIYSIGYALGTNTACTGGGWTQVPKVDATYDRRGNLVTAAVPAHVCNPAVDTVPCEHFPSDHYESPTLYSDDTVQAIASEPANQYFYNQPTPASLNAVFAAIATDIGSGSSRLVDDGF